jgi:ABC-2 type transport system permease protein
VTTTTVANVEKARGAWVIGVERIGLELRAFFRNREAVVFNLSFPVLMLVLFAAIFRGNVGGTNIDFRQVFLAGIIATGIMSTSFNNLAISIAVERHDGTLKRLAGTPMPKVAYFIGKLGMALVIGILETAIMLAFGVTIYGLNLPSDPARWFTFLWVFVLGSLACSAAGIAYSRIPKDGRTAPAVVTPPYIALQFISGVFFVFSDLSKPLQFIASVFPLRWMASGLRYVFLPDAFKRVEPGHQWHLGVGAIVLVAWLVGSVLVSLRTFRFHDER